MLESKGVASYELVKSTFPSIERINKGPVAILECFQEIPCNPCVTSCNINAIKELKDINDIPELIEEKCSGCGICLSSCPGLSIIVVDGSYSDEEVLFKIPYEFMPLPKVGDVVKGLNRSGEYITDVKILKILNPKRFDKTPIVHVLVNRKYLYDFRNIRLEDK